MTAAEDIELVKVIDDFFTSNPTVIDWNDALNTGSLGYACFDVLPEEFFEFNLTMN